MESFGWVLTAIILAYVAVCFRKNCGQARQKPLALRNLAILGWWAFSNTSTSKEKDEKE